MGRGRPAISIVYDRALTQFLDRTLPIEINLESLAMAGSRNFLDNLKNLRVVMSVALEHVRDNHDAFVRSVATSEVPEFELSVSQIRMLAEQLNVEFTMLDSLIAKRPPA